MSVTVTRQDPRYDTLNRGHNARWPVAPAHAASSIEVCATASEVRDALQRTVSAGLRPTIRCGGHCYEDFVVNNPGGVILDLTLLSGTGVSSTPGKPKYRIDAGTPLGVAYDQLYKRSGVTLPGGSCISVAAGGHITGGGYGVLSRLFGLTVDWLTAVDILTVDAHGKVVERHADSTRDADLFRACRGAGGNNFGVVTAFYFDKLPTAPREVVGASMDFPWDGMTPERFEAILTTYGHYMETRGKDPDTWGMFTALVLGHRGTGRGGGGLHLSVQFTNPDGTCNDLRVLDEFLDLFTPCAPVTAAPAAAAGQAAVPQHIDPKFCSGPHQRTPHLWYDVTVAGGIAGYGRSKYKSSYMKRNFTSAECACIYKHLTRELPGANLSGSMLAVDNYGGATNRPHMAELTAIPQRASIMKLQWQSYWSNPDDDASRLQWMKDFYSDLYSGPDADPRFAQTPYANDRYEGCYINYPDSDMLSYPFWPQLYYGDQGLYPFLQSVKRRYDPNNIFHHAMSIRP